CVGAAARVAGQTPLPLDSRHEARSRAGERRVHLEPQQESDQIEVSGSGGCVTFLTEVRFNVAFPFGRSVESVLPAGTSWPLPPGTHRPDTPPKPPVELLLNPRGPCRGLPGVKATSVSGLSKAAKKLSPPQLARFRPTYFATLVNMTPP